MMKGTERLVLIVGGLAAAHFLYNKFGKKLSDKFSLSGTVDSCEDLAATMRMPEEQKRRWIAKCIAEGGDVAEEGFPTILHPADRPFMPMGPPHGHPTLPTGIEHIIGTPAPPTMNSSVNTKDYLKSLKLKYPSLYTQCENESAPMMFPAVMVGELSSRQAYIVGCILRKTKSGLK